MVAYRLYRPRRGGNLVDPIPDSPNHSWMIVPRVSDFFTLVVVSIATAFLLVTRPSVNPSHPAPAFPQADQEDLVDLEKQAISESSTANCDLHTESESHEPPVLVNDEPTPRSEVSKADDEVEQANEKQPATSGPEPALVAPNDRSQAALIVEQAGEDDPVKAEPPSEPPTTEHIVVSDPPGPPTLPSNDNQAFTSESSEPAAIVQRHVEKGVLTDRPQSVLESTPNEPSSTSVQSQAADQDPAKNELRPASPSIKHTLLSDAPCPLVLPTNENRSLSPELPGPPTILGRDDADGAVTDEPEPPSVLESIPNEVTLTIDPIESTISPDAKPLKTSNEVVQGGEDESASSGPQTPSEPANAPSRASPVLEQAVEIDPKAALASRNPKYTLLSGQSGPLVLPSLSFGPKPWKPSDIHWRDGGEKGALGGPLKPSPNGPSLTSVPAAPATFTKAPTFEFDVQSNVKSNDIIKSDSMEISSLKVALNFATQSSTSQRAAAAAAKQRAVAAETELARHKTLLTTVEKARDALVAERTEQAQITSLTLDRERKEKAAISGQLASQVAEASKTKKELAEKDRAIGRLEKAVKNESERAKRAISQVTSELDRVKAKLSATSELETVVKNLREDKAKLSDALNGKSVELDESNKHRREKDAELKELKKRGGGLPKELENVKRQLAEAVSKVSALEKQLVAQKEEKKQVFKQNKGNDHETVAKLKSQLKAANDEVRHLKAQLASESQTHITLHTHRPLPSEAKSNADQEKEALQEKLASVTADFNRKENELLRTKGRLEKKENADQRLRIRCENLVASGIFNLEEDAPYVLVEDHGDEIEYEEDEEDSQSEEESASPSTPTITRVKRRLSPISRYVPSASGPQRGIHFVLRTANQTRLMEVVSAEWFVDNKVEFAVSCQGRSFLDILRMPIKEFSEICVGSGYPQYLALQRMLMKYVMGPKTPARWRSNSVASSSRR